MNTTDDIWVIDDDEAIRFVLQRALSRRGFGVTCFETVGDVRRALRSAQPRALLTDIRLPDADGLSIVDTLEQNDIDIPVIAMTAFADLDQAVSAFQKGVFEYLPKPFDLDQVLSVVERAVAAGQPAPEAEERTGGNRLLGESQAMQEVFRTIGRLSRSDISVLITGETGSGKEVVARVLHENSPRSRGPFVAINTAAVEDPDLIEYALSEQIILATPTSLVALLKAVAYGWRQLSLAENAREIRVLAEDLHARLGAFVGHMNTMGRQLARSVENYNKAVGSLERSVLPGARKFVELGVHEKKQIEKLETLDPVPRTMIEGDSGDDDEDPLNQH